MALILLLERRLPRSLNLNVALSEVSMSSVSGPISPKLADGGKSAPSGVNLLALCGRLCTFGGKYRLSDGLLTAEM